MFNRFLRSSEPQRPFLKWNFVANVCDGAIFSLAMSFVSLQTVLPVFVKKIGGSNVAVGLIPVLWTVGFNFPQIFIANFTQRFARKNKLVLTTAMVQRTPWLLLALLSFFLVARTNTEIGLLLFFSVFALAAIGGSINLPVWFDLVAKITPVDLRGRLFGVRQVLGAMLGVFGGWVVTKVLAAVAYPASFALLFLLAFITMMVSYIFLAILKEENGARPEKQVSYKSYLRSLPRILRQQHNYRNFLIADALLITATMASAFYTVSALEKFSLADAHAGTFIIVMMTSMMAGNLFFGYLADHFGHRLNLLLAAIVTAGTCLTALLAPTVEIYLLVFAGAAFTIGLTGISRLPIITEFCSNAERPTYIALTNMITSPFVLSGLAGGWLANRFGYDTVFIIATILALASAVWLAQKVEEPRKLNFSTVVRYEAQ
ncbi:MFS transporter [candidate division KSB1 bacterium]|nr:MFS transporter [candidate division KSB1 bacterium]